MITLSKTQIAFFREGNTQKGINKQGLSLSAVQTAWTSDGLRFAIGFENGTISIRDKDNDKEIKNIVLNNQCEERVWCLSFSSTKHYNKDYTLIVGTWEKNIYIIELFNYSVLEIKKLNYDPICITLFRDDYFLVGSNNNEINLFTKDGIFVNNITEEVDSWVLALKVNFNLIFNTNF